jgi:hypothetical protein
MMRIIIKGTERVKRKRRRRTKRKEENKVKMMERVPPVALQLLRNKTRRVIQTKHP